MAEQTVQSVASAVTGELTSRVFSGLIQRYGKHAATREKLQRLEMLLIKIHSAVKASEKCTIENPSLLRWRDKLKKAASQGDEVLASFAQLAKDGQATSNADANQQQGEAVSSSAAAPTTATGALSFTANSLSGMVQGIRNATQILFSSGDNDMERLNRTLVRLGMLSPHIGVFIGLLHLEASPKVDQTPYEPKVDQTPYDKELSTEGHGPKKRMRTMGQKKRMERSITKLSTITKAQEPQEQAPTDTHCHPGPSETGPIPTLGFSPPKGKKMKGMAAHTFDGVEEDDHKPPLQDRVEAAFAEICKAVELADSRDFEGLEWLAYWAGILREAKEQGCDVLSATSARKTVNAKDNESMVECDQEKGELRSIVHRLEGLAKDVEYFCKLVYLCTAC